MTFLRNDLELQSLKNFVVIFLDNVGVFTKSETSPGSILEAILR